MIKQIRTNKFIENVMDRGDDYFTWLQMKAGICDPLAIHLYNVEFKSVDGIDDITMKSAKENLREEYSQSISEDSKERELIRKSVRGSCCLLEIIVYLAEAVRDLVSISEDDKAAKFVRLMLLNARYYEKSDNSWWDICSNQIIKREYEDLDKIFGLFLTKDTSKSLWQQMNNWIDSHTNEDGEWIDTD